MTPAIALITALLIGSAAAEGNMAKPVDSSVAAPRVAGKMDSNLRGIVPVANAIEKIHAPPNWQPPSDLSACLAFATIFLIPAICLIGMKCAKDGCAGWGPCLFFGIPI